MAQPEPFSWWEITKLVGSGLVGGLLTQLLALWREARRDSGNQERDARYLALRLAVILERFAIECADLLGDLAMHHSSQGHAGKRHTRLPELSDYPADADWKAIQGDLAARALNTRNERLLAVRQVAGSWDYLDEDGVGEECADLAGLHGFRAWILARDLRHRHDLPVFDPTDVAYDFVAVLRERRDQVVERRRREREADQAGQ